jgi:hypothetical protein
MGIHGDDVVLTIRRALKEGETCPTQSEVRMHPRPFAEGETADNTWRHRDGKLVFDCVGRDWFRAFRVTVEAIPVNEFKGEYGSEEWVVAE